MTTLQYFEVISGKYTMVGICTSRNYSQTFVTIGSSSKNAPVLIAYKCLIIQKTSLYFVSLRPAVLAERAAVCKNSPCTVGKLKQGI